MSKVLSIETCFFTWHSFKKKKLKNINFTVDSTGHARNLKSTKKYIVVNGSLPQNWTKLYSGCWIKIKC